MLVLTRFEGEKIVITCRDGSRVVVGLTRAAGPANLARVAQFLQVFVEEAVFPVVARRPRRDPAQQPTLKKRRRACPCRQSRQRHSNFLTYPSPIVLSSHRHACPAPWRPGIGLGAPRGSSLQIPSCYPSANPSGTPAFSASILYSLHKKHI